MSPGKVSPGEVVRSELGSPPGSQLPTIRVQGVVKESLPHALYRTELDSGELVLAHLAEPLRLHAVRMLPGDRVALEISRLDWSRGRIVKKLGKG